MNPITHEQAAEYIHLGPAGLEPAQREALTAHLSGCPDCQAYARLNLKLAPAISRALHHHWDGQLSRANKPAAIMTTTRRNHMLRHSFSFTQGAILLGILILGLAGVLIWVRPPATQPAASPSGPVATAASTPAALTPRLAPSVCSEQAYPAPAGVVLPYPAKNVIGGGTVQNGGFTFQIYLYCDEALSPDDPGHYSAIGGLGIYAWYSYTGPKQEGWFWDMFGFEPDVNRSSGYTVLTKVRSGSAAGLSFGGESEGPRQVSEQVKAGKPLQYSVKVQANDQLYGATLSFSLRDGEDGYVPAIISTRALPVETVPIEKFSLEGTEPQGPGSEGQILPPIGPTVRQSGAVNGLIAFVSSQEGNAEIYTMRPDGRQVTNLTKDPAEDRDPVWSPDGKRIAFVSTRRVAAGEIYVMNADGSQVRLIATNSYGGTTKDRQGRPADPQTASLSWSPDGQYLLAEFSLGPKLEACVEIARVDMGRGICFNNLPFDDPRWSPDGSYLSILNGADGRSLSVLDAVSLLHDDTRRELLVFGRSGWAVQPGARWSPDGRRLAFFAVNSGTKTATLWVVPANGKGAKSLFELSGDDPLTPPVWSPDGKRIAFVAQGAIKLVNMDGGEVASLVAAENAGLLEWSPDGKQLLFTAQVPRQLYRLDVTQALEQPAQVLPVQLTQKSEFEVGGADWQAAAP